jgi:hypothetical protein
VYFKAPFAALEAAAESNRFLAVAWSSLAARISFSLAWFSSFSARPKSPASKASLA